MGNFKETDSERWIPAAPEAPPSGPKPRRGAMFIAKVAYPSIFLLFFSGTAASYLQHFYRCSAAVPLKNKRGSVAETINMAPRWGWDCCIESPDQCRQHL